MAFLNSVDSTSDWSQQKRRGEENSTKAFQVGQKSFVNVLLIRKIWLCTMFSRAEQPANVPCREMEMCALLSELNTGKPGNSTAKLSMLGWGTTFPVSTFAFFCVTSTFPQNLQVLVSHTSAPRHSWVLLMIQHETSSSFLLLQWGRSTPPDTPICSLQCSVCPSAWNYHWGMARQLLLGCHI